MKTEILATLGPASLNERVIARLTGLGVTLFRLNLSHTRLEDAADRIRFVQQVTQVPLCLDTEGAQVRTGDFVEASLSLRENSTVRVPRRRVPGDSRSFNLYPDTVVPDLVAGDFLSIDASVLAQVVEVTDEEATLRVLSGGSVGRNKAVTVERDIGLPPLTHKDLGILRIGRDLGIQNVALSFASRADDLAVIREAAGPDARVISKIESRSGLRNLAEIAARSDALLIDRGDLSRQVPLERIPAVQKAIIRAAKAAGRPVYVATNLMESMVTEPHPTRAEVNDVYNTLIDGADGLVMAAETAIGRYPIECVGMVVKLAREFESARELELAHEFETAEHAERAIEATDTISLLVAPHGGRLQAAAAPEAGFSDASPPLSLAPHQLVDLIQLARGTYSPLTGFMDRETLERVLAEGRLLDGTSWPLPILLQTPDPVAVDVGERVALVDPTGTARGWLDVSERFEIDVESSARAWFGTDDPSHPGVRLLAGAGRHCIAGPVIPRDGGLPVSSPYELPPAQSRFIFVRKGWNRVVGFHTNVVPRIGHETAQRAALEASHADGLLITVAAGPTSAADEPPDSVLRSHQRLLEFAVYPTGRVALGSLQVHPRHCAIREALFLALCHKNLGCSHFALACGIAPTGDPDTVLEVRREAERLGDLDIDLVEVDARDPANRFRELIQDLAPDAGGEDG